MLYVPAPTPMSHSGWFFFFFDLWTRQKYTKKMIFRKNIIPFPVSSRYGFLCVYPVWDWLCFLGFEKRYFTKSEIFCFYLFTYFSYLFLYFFLFWDSSYVYFKLFAIVSQVSGGSFSLLPLPLNSFCILVWVISVDSTRTLLILYYASLLVSPLKDFQKSLLLLIELLIWNGCWSTLFEYLCLFAL